MITSGLRYDNLYHRLVSNTHEPENGQACWAWSGVRDRWGYGRLNIYVPGLARKVKVMAHIALWVWLMAAPGSVDDFYLAYQEFVTSGLELDHRCVHAACIYVDHLEPVTSSINAQRRSDRNGR